MAHEVNRRIEQIRNENLNRVVRYNWRVVWTFFVDGKEVSRGTKDFTNSINADEFITLLRKKATYENKGILVERVDIRNKGKQTRKRYNKGYKRQW